MRVMKRNADNFLWKITAVRSETKRFGIFFDWQLHETLSPTWEKMKIGRGPERRDRFYTNSSAKMDPTNHKYVGGYIVFPFDPSLSVQVPAEIVTSLWPDDKDCSPGTKALAPTGTEPLIDATFDVIHQCIKIATSQCLCFLYIFYPITNADPAWLFGEEHGKLLFKLYTAASAAAFDTGNPTIDLRVLPVIVPHEACTPKSSIPLFSKSQIDTIRSIIRVDDPLDNRFIERRTSTGPIACFACPPAVWHATLRPNNVKSHEAPTSELVRCLTGSSSVEELENQGLCINEDAGDLPEEVRHAEFLSTLFLRELLAITTSQIAQVVEFTSEDTETKKFRRIDGNIKLPYFPLSQVARSLIGGSFDHIHPGHKFILSLSVMSTRTRLTVGISSDDAPLVEHKKGRKLLQPWVLRAGRLVDFVEVFCRLLRRESKIVVPSELASLSVTGSPPKFHSVAINSPSFMYGPRSNPWWTEADLSDAPIPPYPTKIKADGTFELEIVKICDVIGPAASRDDFNSLIVTPETITGGAMVNDARALNNLPPLAIVELPMIPSSEIVVPDVSIHDTPRLRDPTSATSPRTDYVGERGRRHRYSMDKTSSTHIREKISELPALQRLSDIWQQISLILLFPPLFSAAWGIRLLECFSSPWRQLNRARVLLAMEKIWLANVPHITTEETAPSSDVDKGWLSIMVWLGLVSASSHSKPDENLTLENILSRAKCSELIQLFCSDLYTASWLGPFSERVKLSKIWRCSGSRLQQILPANASAADNNNSASSDVTTEINSTANASRQVLAMQHGHLNSTWRSDPGYLDLNNNLREACLYIVDAFVPKNLQSDYLGKPATASFLLLAHTPCDKCAALEESTILPELCGREIFGHLSGYNVIRRLDLLALIDRSAKDFLRAYTRVFDLFAYLFFHDSHRTLLANSSIVQLMTETLSASTLKED